MADIDPIEAAARAAYAYRNKAIGNELSPWEERDALDQAEWLAMIGTAVAAYLVARAEQVAAMPEHGNRQWYAMQLTQDAAKILARRD
jgi:hypothetical protein